LPRRRLSPLQLLATKQIDQVVENAPTGSRIVRRPWDRRQRWVVSPTSRPGTPRFTKVERPEAPDSLISRPRTLPLAEEGGVLEKPVVKLVYCGAGDLQALHGLAEDGSVVG
jgi:hypothetical protein